MRTITCVAIMGCLIAAFWITNPSVTLAAPETITLKCVTFLPKTEPSFKYFFEFIDRIQKQSNGRLEVKLVGGPEAIPSFEQMQALRSGVVDLLATVSAYYIGDLKEAMAFQYGNITPQEERKVGFYDLMDKLHQQKLNVKYLGRFCWPARFYFYSRVPLRTIADFKGKRIRGNPGYEPFLKALGATSVNTTFAEVFSVMERGVVDAFGWPTIGVLFFGWDSVFKYVITPGWYEMNAVAHMNLNTWKKLPDDLKKIVMDNVLWMEKETVPYWEAWDKEQLKIMKEQKGKEIITVDDPEGYLKMSMDAAWKVVKEACPETGPVMEKMIRR